MINGLFSADVEEAPFMDLASGYIQRALEMFPKQGSKAPWKLYQNYFIDIVNFRHSSLKSKELEFK